MKLTLSIIAMFAVISEIGSAATIVNYSSGIAASNGATGAANPTSQGWSTSTTPTASLFGASVGNGGWSTFDGTSTGAFFYTQNLDTSKQAQMNQGWSMTFVFALNKDFYNSSTNLVSSSNYYVGANYTRQANTSVGVQWDGKSLLTGISLNSNNQIVFTITGASTTTLNTTINAQSGYPEFVTATMTWDAVSGKGVFSYDDNNGNSGTQADLATASTTNNRVFFGQGNSSGQGSTIWNDVNISTTPIPEPSSAGLLGVGLAGMLLRRRRKQA